LTAGASGAGRSRVASAAAREESPDSAGQGVRVGDDAESLWQTKGKESATETKPPGSLRRAGQGWNGGV